MTAAVLLGATALRVAASEIDTASHKISPDAVDAGGGSGSSTSYQFVFGVGESAVAPASFTSSSLDPGLMSLASFPGTVANLSAVAASSVAARASWSAPGYDGGLGALQPGSSYYIQFSSDPNQAWAYSAAQVILSTSAVNPGDAQGALISGLLPNTTTFFRLWTEDAQGDLSALSNGATAAALAIPPVPGPQPYRMVGVSSATLAWGTFAASPSSMTAEGYVLQASTAPDFSGTILSSSTPNVALSTLTVTGLFSNTTYYFRVGALNWAGLADYALAGSTLTQISPDVTPPSAVSDLSASTWSATSALLTWSAPSDPDNVPLNGTYAVQYATYTAGLAFSTASAQVLVSTLNVTAGSAQGLVVSGLSANTTYFFKLWSADSKPNWSSLSNGATVATLANAVSAAQILTLSTGTATLGWAALPPSPLSASAEGYRLEVSSTNFGALSPGGLVYSSATTGLAASTLTVSGLDPNTTYYYRVASLNWTQAPDYATIPASATWANPATALSPVFLGVFNSSATAQWAALPTSPSTATSEGYRLEASSTNFGALSPGGLVYSSSTASVLASTLTVSGLAPNTTYFFRVASLDWGGTANYTNLAATSTLADPPVSPAPTQLYTTSATVSWTAPATGSEGYAVLASSTNFGALSPGGRIYSSFAYDGTLLGLAVTGLDPNTTYYFQAGTLNWNGVPAYAAAGSSVTLANAPARLAADFFAVYATSAAAQWAALPASPSTATAEGYRLEASSTNFGALSAGGLVYSSSTASVLASTLTVSGLAVNTTYYFRVASLDWGGTANYANLAATSTLANAPVSIASTYTAVAATSLTAQWSANGDPAWTQFVLQFSTAANFSGAIFSSTAPGTSAAVSGLAPNTVYYGQVQALNNGGIATAFAALGSTETLATPPGPGSPAFSPVYASSLTLAFTAGNPANPAGSFYGVQLSSFSDFRAVYSSVTANLTATFQGLTPNTTYYGQAQGLNGLGQATAFVSLGSSATLAAAPGPVTSTYSAVAADGFTMTWSSGALATGYNPWGTTYQVQASTAANFTGTLTQIVTASTAATFSGLVSGTVYYTRVRALNYQNIPSTFTTYGSVTTLNSSKPVFLAGSFQVADSLGVYQPSTLYTDTTTPKLQVQVQSNFAPGLSVADTPSQLAVWHMDDGSGTAARDASRHNKTLTLAGAPPPAWVAGVTSQSKAIAFDGTQNYSVSPTLVPWRNSAANNQWSVSMWFKTTLAQGYLFQVANSNAAGAATADGELAWSDATGNLVFEVDNGAAATIIEAPSGYTDGAWHNVTAVLNTTGQFLYVDGALAVSGTGVTSTNARTYAGPTYAWVGAASAVDVNIGLGGTVRFSAATLDEVMITTVSLTAQQVSAYYSLVSAQSHLVGMPNVDISTQSGNAGSWVRISTNAFAVTGTKGTTAAQVWTSTLSLISPLLVQTASPGAATDQVMLLASSLDSNFTTAQFTLLVDTTPPAVPTFTALLNPTTAGFDLSGLAASDALAGLSAAPFDVQASTDPLFGVVNQDSGWIPGPSFTFTSLNPDTTYFVRARARDAAGSQGNKSAWSASQNLATLAVTPSTTTPAFLGVFTTSATAAWIALPPAPSSRSAQGYELDASTAPDFSGTLYSSVTAAVAASTLTVSGLSANTTYFFRVGSLNQASVLDFIALASTPTLSNPVAAISPVFLNVYASSLTAQWAALPASPPSATSEGYRLEASSTNFGAALPGGAVYSSSTANILASTLTVSGLDPNTTYYLRVAALNWNQTPAYTTLSATSTLANAIAGPNFSAVYISSVAVAWGTFPPSPSSMTAEGYVLQASTAPDFSSTILSSSTPNVALSTLTVTGLFSNTTYFFRVGALDWNGAVSYVLAGSTLTRVSVDVTPPSAVADLAASTQSAAAVFLSWTAPSDPDNAPLDGTYAIQYATYTAGLVFSTANAQVLVSTLGVVAGSAQGLVVSGLSANTTYFFRLWSADSKPNWSSLSNGATVATLANPVASAQLLSLSTGTATAGWAALPPSPLSASAEGYRLEVSSTNFGVLSPGGVIYTSATASVLASTLTVSGLDPNTTYYYRVASLNWAQAPDYATIAASATWANPATALSPAFLGVFNSSAAAQWAALPTSPSTATSEGYRLEASSTNFGALSPGGLVYSSSTASVLASTLTVSGLAPNTTYFFRVASLDWGGTANYTNLAATSTLANAPVSIASTYTAVAATSLTAQWSANGDPAWTQFVLQFSTAANFTGTIFSSTAPGTSAAVSGLAPNTVYYGQVQALNNGGIPTAFVALGSTETAASQPAAAVPAFAPVYVSSLAVDFTAGTPPNPSGSFYLVQLSSFSDFRAVYSSNTANLYAYFLGLTPNTTYYGQVQGINGLNVATAFASLGSSPTLAAQPGPVVSTYSAVAADGFTMTWSSGALATGYNPWGTTYQAQASTAANFTGTLTQIITASTAATFSGLVSGTVYYTRVRALNYQSIPSTFTTYGSVTTLNSSKPVFLAGSFQVADSLGVYQPASLYTDTTTPKLQVQVQSNFAPGLSVADTPSQLAVWHMDDGSGTAARDASRHNKTLTLAGAPPPAWVAGVTSQSKAIAFDGTQNYSVSPTLVPWRNSAANNQWSVSMWFKTTLAQGYLFQVANSNAAGAATYDGELAWSDATGNLDFEVATGAGVATIIEAPSGYTDGAWHNVTAVLNTTGQLLYVDGALAASGAGVTSTNARTYAGPTYAWVGAASAVDVNIGLGGTVRFSQATIDEVMITTVSLTAQQVSAYYSLVSAQSHLVGMPNVDVSTQSGNAGSWVRISTNAFAVTGAPGTTAAQVWTSTLSLISPLLVQTASPGAATDQVMLLASSLDSNFTTAQFTLLVDTTPPAVPTFTALLNPTTAGFDLSGLAASDALAGLSATPFDVQASTDPNFGVVNQDSGWIAGPAFTFAALNPNTTYFVRARARDAAGSQGNKSAWSASQNLATLALAPTALPTTFLYVDGTSVTVAWAALAASPPDASSKTCEGYLLQASSSNFGALGAGAPTFSSATASVLASTLTVGSLASPLDLSNTYYFQVASLNWAGTPNTTTLSRLNFQIAQSTNEINFAIGFVGAGGSLVVSTITTSSMVVTNVGNWPTTIELAASTATPGGSPWTLATSSGIETAALLGVWYAGSVGPPATAFNTYLTTTTQVSQAAGNYSGTQNGYQLPAGASVTLWFRFFAPWSTSTTNAQRILVTAQPVYP